MAAEAFALEWKLNIGPFSKGKSRFDNEWGLVNNAVGKAGKILISKET